MSTNEDVETNSSWPLNMSPITIEKPRNTGLVSRVL